MRFGRCAAAALVLGLATFCPTAASATPSDASVPLECQPYLVDATGLLALDLLTGDTRQVTEAEGLTAAGYNVHDNLVYVWDAENGGIGALGEGTYEFLGAVRGLPDEEWDGGDVDIDRTFWLLSSATGAWAGVDLETRSLIATGESDLRAGDWSVSLERYGELFTLGTDATMAFSTAGHVVTEVGVSAGAAGRVTGTWADATRYLYVLIDDTTIVRAETEDVRVLPFSSVSVTPPTDGVWCHDSILFADWGDAPDSYGTSLASDGPRHSIPIIGADTAPLMLGEMITTEATAGRGDSDGDDGVYSAMVVSATDPLVVDVVVTNDMAGEATLLVWLDEGGSGRFREAPNVTVAVPAESGAARYQVELPAPGVDTWLRLRVVPGANVTLTPWSAVAGGEVEDWFVRAEPAVQGLTLRDAAFDGASVSVRLANTGNVAQSPRVEAEGLCVLLDGETRIAPGTEISMSCDFTPPQEDARVAVTAVDGDVAAVPVNLTWDVAELEEEPETTAPAVPEEPAAETRPGFLLPIAIVGGGVLLLVVAAVAATRATREDD